MFILICLFVLKLILNCGFRGWGFIIIYLLALKLILIYGLRRWGFSIIIFYSILHFNYYKNALKFSQLIIIINTIHF